MSIISIRDLEVSVDDTKILKGVNLDINKGEIHVIMGPNGSGKSTLASTIVGNPVFEVDKGDINFKGKDILEMEVDERAREGIFLSFQAPFEIPGLKLNEFLRTAKESVSGKKQGIFKFQRELEKLMKELEMPVEYADRSLNDGFSGGEKKKSEILQMAVLEPSLSILDETDSGLDIDATKVVFENIQKIKQRKPEMAIMVITHYNKVLEYLKPDFVHVIMDGKIVKTGGYEIVEEVEEYGYDKIRGELSARDK